MKVCTKCKIEKDNTCFRENKQYKDGLTYYCRDCFSIERLKYFTPKPIEFIDRPSEEGEIWKELLGYEGLYDISNHGRIFSYRYHNGKSGRIRSLGKRTGYLQIHLYDKYLNKSTILVHILVARVFISNPNNKPMVNHIDKNRANNNVNNLEWVDNRENQTHGFSTIATTSKYTGVWLNKNTKKWVASIRINNKANYLGTYVIEEDAAQAYKDALVKYGLTNKYA